MTGIRYEILARRPKNREKRDFGKLKFLKAQGLGARFLPLRGLGAILGTPGWNCNVVCTKFVVLWRNCLWKAVAGSGGWELRPVEGSVGWEGLSKMKLVLLSFGSVTGLTKKVDPLSTTHVTLSIT